MKYRIAYLVTHPIQYQAPLLRRLSAEPDFDLTVFFQSDVSLRAYHDAGFGRSFQWDVPLLDGYRHEFLPAIARRDQVNGLGPLSYGIASRLWHGRFDVLWVHGYALWFNWVAICAAKAAGIAVLVRDEATPTSARRSPGRKALKRMFFTTLKRVCDGFLAIGTLNREYYLQNGIDPERIFLMPYCVDNDYFASLARAAAPGLPALREELALAPDRPVILFASKFQRRKRAADLVDAFERLTAGADPRRMPYLVLAGDGEARPELEARAARVADAVRFVGFRNQSELPAFFDLCDVFVLPSEHEPWGLVVNEAMSAGRAVVVSDQVGCGPDLVRDGVNGYIYRCGDVEGLADALRNVLQEPDRARAMGAASAEIIGGWNFERDIAGLRDAVEAVTASGGR